MTEWKLAMLMLSPFMRGRQMLRVWIVLMGASIAAHFANSITAFMAIDAVAAALVLARPAGLPQRLIGALFAWMLFMDLGFYLSAREGWGLFLEASSAAGWVQWAILGAWSGHDAWRNYRGWADAPYRPPSAYERRVR